MNNKKQASAKQTVIHTIQVGDVVAEIRLKKSNSGFSYLDYTLERSFTTSTNKQSRGSTFFAVNQEDLIQAVEDASAWIRSKANAAPTMDALAEQTADTQ